VEDDVKVPSIFITTYPDKAIKPREWFLNEAINASKRNADYPCKIEVLSSMDSDPAKKNRAVEMAEDIFVLLHDDSKPAKGFLRNMVVELEWAEEYFKKPVIICPTDLPYFVPENLVEKYPELKPNRRLVTLRGEYERYSRHYGIPFDGEDLVCKPPYRGPIRRSGTPVTDDGHTLIIFCSRKRTMQIVGPCEEWSGSGYYDMDWGLRALMKGVKVLQSHTTYVMHLYGLSFGYRIKRYPSNRDRFIEKWGMEFYKSVHDGSKWIELHEKQLLEE